MKARINAPGGEREVLRPRKRRYLALLLVSLTFTVGGVWMIFEGEGFGWFVAIFFGVCVATFVGQLLPNAAYLTIGETGVEARSLNRSHVVPYADVEAFYPISIGGNRMIGIAYAPNYEGQRAGHRLARSLGGTEGALDALGHDVDELVTVLEERRQLALRRNPDAG